jgi:hypothetical protein
MLANDEDVVRAAVNQTCLALVFASPRWQNQQDVFLLALKTFHHTAVCDLNLRRGFLAVCKTTCSTMNRQAALDCVSVCGAILQYLPTTLQEDADVALAALRQDKSVWTLIPHLLFDSKQFVLQALTLCGAVWYKLHEHWHFRDAEVWDVLCKHGNALSFVEPQNQTKEFVMDQVCKNGLALRFADCFQNDEDVVRAAVQNRGTSLQDAGASLKACKSIVMAAVCNDGLALQFACDELRSDEQVVLAAIRQNTDAYPFVRNAVSATHHTDFLYEALKHSSSSLRLLLSSPENSRIAHLILFAVGQHSDALKQIGSRVQLMPACKRVVFQAMMAFPQAIAHLTPDLRKATCMTPLGVAMHFAACCAAQQQNESSVQRISLDEAMSAALSCCSRELCIRSVCQLLASLPNVSNVQTEACYK